MIQSVDNIFYHLIFVNAFKKFGQVSETKSSGIKTWGYLRKLIPMFAIKASSMLNLVFSIIGFFFRNKNSNFKDTMRIFGYLTSRMPFNSSQRMNIFSPSGVCTA